MFHYLVSVVLLAVRFLFIFWFLLLRMKVLKVDLGLLTDSITILPASLFSVYF